MRAIALTPEFSVGSQMTRDDLAAAAKSFRSIVNNRPDGEEPGQPASADLEAEAAKLGLEYRHIPVTGQLNDEAVQALAAARAEMETPVLAFCRSGMRSAALWALSEAAKRPSGEIVRIAAEAGYDISMLTPRLEQGRTEG